jgi:hypothetical protein
MARAFVMHPVHRIPQAADARARDALFDAAGGRLTVPARTAVVVHRRPLPRLPDDRVERQAAVGRVVDQVRV